MLGLGWQELVIVLVIIMIIFGAGKLPEVARSLGQGVKEFKLESNADDSLAAGATAAAARGETTASTEPVEHATVRANDI